MAQPRTRKIWTDDEIQIVRDTYADTLTSEIAVRLGRTTSSIYGLITKLGIYKSEEFRKSQQSGRFDAYNASDRSKANRFKKGQVPHNKGLRRPGWHRGRMRETMFKKGSIPPNRREIGDERIDADGYVYVKIQDGTKNKNWKQKSWIVWEQHNGPVPKQANIVFRDGNRQNCDIANLQCITDAEIALRNHWRRYPKEIRDQIRTLAGFRRKLNTYAKKQDRRSA